LLDAAVILTVACVTGETVSQCDEVAAKDADPWWLDE
jgi:hypothetical protein